MLKKLSQLSVFGSRKEQGNYNFDLPCVADEKLKDYIKNGKKKDRVDQLIRVKFTWMNNFEVTYIDTLEVFYNGYILDIHDYKNEIVVEVRFEKYQYKDEIRKPYALIAMPYYETIGLNDVVTIDKKGCIESNENGIGIVMGIDDSFEGYANILIGFENIYVP